MGRGPAERRYKSIRAVVVLVLLALSTLLVVPAPYKVHASSPATVLGGWGGVRLADTDQNLSAPPSLVFAGEKQSSFEQVVIREAQLGYNTVRGSFAPYCAQRANNFMGTYNSSQLARAVNIAQFYDFWLTVDYHGHNEFQTNDSTSCWLNFWFGPNPFSGPTGIVGQFQNSYDKIIWEPLNEPNMTGTGATDAAWTSSSSIAFQKWINQDRTVGDTHWIVVQNTCSYFCHNPRSLWYLDYPVVNDTLGRVFESLHTYLYYPSYVEHLAYDNDSNGVFDSGDTAIVGDIPDATVLTTDLKIKFVNATNDSGETWAPGKSIVYDNNSTGVYETGDTPAAGTVPPIGALLRTDPKIRFTDTNKNGVWDSYWNNATADNIAQTDHLTMLTEIAGQSSGATPGLGWPVLNTEGGAFCSIVCPYAVPGAAGYSTVSLRYIQDMVRYEDDNNPRLGWVLWPAAPWTDTPNAGGYGAIGAGEWGTMITYRKFTSFVLVSTPNVRAQPFLYPWDGSGFYAQGRHWIFYINYGNCSGTTANCLYYATSPNGVGWTSINVGVVTGSRPSLATNGTHVFYARYDGNSGNLGRALMFRVGALNADGTINWQAETVVKEATPGQEWYGLSTRISTTGQVFVAYRNVTSNGGGGFAWVIHSNGTDYSTWKQDTLLKNLTDGWRFSLARLSSGRMYILYWPDVGRLFGRLWSDGGWGPEEAVAPSGNAVRGNAFAFGTGNNTVYAVWQENLTERLLFASRTGSWSAPETIGTAETNINPRWTASYDPLHEKWSLIYYNYTLNQVYQYSGAPGSWSQRTELYSTQGASSGMSIGSYYEASGVDASSYVLGVFWTQNDSTSGRIELMFADEAIT